MCENSAISMAIAEVINRKQSAVGVSIKRNYEKTNFQFDPEFIILSLSGCKQDNSPAPLKFKAYEHNPILSSRRTRLMG